MRRNTHSWAALTASVQNVVLSGDRAEQASPGESETWLHPFILTNTTLEMGHMWHKERVNLMMPHGQGQWEKMNSHTHIF